MYESIMEVNNTWNMFENTLLLLGHVHILQLHSSSTLYPWVSFAQWVQQQMHCDCDIQTFRDGKVHLLAIIFQSIIRYGSPTKRKFFANSIWEKLFYTFRSLFDFTEWKMILHLLTNHSINIRKCQISCAINSVPIHIHISSEELTGLPDVYGVNLKSS